MEFTFPKLPNSIDIESSSNGLSQSPLFAARQSSEVAPRTSTSAADPVKAENVEPQQNPLLAAATVRHNSGGTSGTSSNPVEPINVTSRTDMPPPRRNKVPLEKGFSQVAWLRLTQTHPDLAGLAGAPARQSISMEEVAQHNTEQQAWIVVRGKVYNVTPYLQYHPGGSSILARQAGRDCTALFNKYHAWVNADMLLQKCFIGMLEPPSN